MYYLRCQSLLILIGLTQRSSMQPQKAQALLRPAFFCCRQEHGTIRLGLTRKMVRPGQGGQGRGRSFKGLHSPRKNLQRMSSLRPCWISTCGRSTKEREIACKHRNAKESDSGTEGLEMSGGLLSGCPAESLAYNLGSLGFRESRAHGEDQARDSFGCRFLEPGGPIEQLLRSAETRTNRLREDSKPPEEAVPAVRISECPHGAASEVEKPCNFSLWLSQTPHQTTELLERRSSEYCKGNYHSTTRVRDRRVS